MVILSMLLEGHLGRVLRLKVVKTWNGLVCLKFP